jgi:hypothetical protein
MRNLLFIFLLTPFCLFAQDTGYAMYETMYMTSKAENAKQLDDNLAAHNKKYHAEDPYQAGVFYVVNGPHEGSYFWVMGPTTWTALDDRPSDGGHDDDWADNVAPLCESQSLVEYWKLDQKLSRFPGEFKLTKQLVWYFDIASGKGSKATELLGKVNKVNAKHYPDDTYGVYRNQFANNTGRDIAMVWFFENYAWMDDDSNFGKKFEEEFGSGSWSYFLTEWREATEGRVDELREFVPELSTMSETVEAPNE